MAKTFIQEFEDWLRVDQWSMHEACMILSGAIPWDLKDSSDERIRISDGGDVTRAMIREYARIQGLWNRSSHPLKGKGGDGIGAFPQISIYLEKCKVRPCYAINWARKKGIDIPWYSEAEQLGFKVGKPTLKEEAGTPVVQKMVSQTKIDNELRVWGHLLKVVKEAYKCDQKTLIAKIQASVDPDELRNKGLGERNIKEVFAKANKVLEEDNS